MKNIIITFLLERVVVERIKIDDVVTEIKTPVWFRMEYNTESKVCIFVGKNSTVFDIAQPMVKVLVGK